MVDDGVDRRATWRGEPERRAPRSGRVAQVALTCAVLAPAAAAAEPVTVKPIFDARIRYEHVDQDGLAREADALTTRLRTGAEVASGPWSMLIEGEATVALVDDYFNGVRGPTDRPLVLDPENVELNRAQVRYAGLKNGAVTLGRQRIELLDQRFVGGAAFRQNEQTFDALRLQYGAKSGPTLDVSYVWSVRTVNGSRGRGARQTAVDGDNLFAVAGLPTPVGTISAFALLVDQDEALVQAYRLSSQTYGVRLAGSRPAGPATLSYAASYARQSDYHRNPNDYSATYLLAEASAAAAGFTATAGYEELGADDGRALTSFQTPLATLFKFNGWADRFVVTPPNGLRDLYFGAGYGAKKVGPADAITLSATWHRFESDRLDLDYGREIDLLASAKIGRTTLAARYAGYRTKGFATDTDRFWLSADFVF
ncbi:alginate export family protein [Allosphingosinicella deserti]|uniref:Alginate export domain-containing protein n=1 Tax=Allosphingosinicella deserti TaxID=2116704 RepID=A0A2P7QVW5_9SPHN|nr:alginate export family protein [Sphingomonas deserti]PSJ42080.1 hypothetical protein C7I55_07500 [Sphingomonas deserti]